MRFKLGTLTLAFSALLASQSAFADQLVTNGGFETGDFTGWHVAVSGTAPTTPALFYGVDAQDAASGNDGAYLGTEFQTLALSQYLTVQDNHDYTVSFSLANLGGPLSGFNNSFTLSLGGTTIFTESNAPASAYTNYSFSFDTTSTTPTSELLLINSENDASEFSLDNVSVATATPEPATLLLVVPAVGLLALKRRKMA
jgi:hypothetical protein